MIKDLIIDILGDDSGIWTGVGRRIWTTS